MEILNKTLLLVQLVVLAFLPAGLAGAEYPGHGSGNDVPGELPLPAEEPLTGPRNTLVVGGTTLVGSGVSATGEEPGPIRLVINELLASNVECLADPQGEFDDWIELHNPGDTPIDAGGMHLTDDMSSPTKWQIPLDRPAATTIPPHGYLVIWADGDIADPGLHAAFSLSAGGEEIALTDVDGTALIDSIRFGGQKADISYGRFPDGSDAWSLMALPTPGGRNVRIHEGFVDEPQVLPGHGFYRDAILVTVTCQTPDVVIYYTMDGSEPWMIDSGLPNPQARVYSEPLQISRTTCLRVAAMRPGWHPSPIETQTYVFVEDVIRQSPGGQSPGGRWPSGTVNGQLIDYGMDPDVVNDPRYKDLMDDALLSIPSVSLVTDLANLFDPAKGIYVNAGREGRDWERPVSVELIHPDGREGFQIDAGIRIRGGFSRSGNNPKHSFRLFFRSEYGSPSLKYPLFGSEGVEEFENLDLRTAQNYAWSLQSSNPGEKNTFVREVFCRDLQRETGQPYTRSRYYHLYLNGQFWGLYESQERSEASYAATYFGGAPDDYDVVKADNYQTSYTDGSIDEWNLLWALCQEGFEGDAEYYAVQGKKPDGTDDPDIPVRVDVDNLTDYMIGIFYTGNDDAPVALGGNRANNFFAIRNRRIEARDGWKFFAYDNEHSLGVRSGANDDRTGPVTAGQSRDHFNPQWLHQKLMVHPEYRMRFADHTHKHFFNRGVMTPEKAAALCLARANEIDLAIIAESARWGDQRPARANNPYTKADWWAEVNGYLIGTFFPARTQIVLNQLKSRGLYPNVNAPVFNINGTYQHGGRIEAGDSLSLTGGTGAIWYTLDGSDPRVPGTTADPTEEPTLVAENAAKRVLVPTGPVSDAWKGGQTFDDSAWTSGLGGVGYERSTGYEPFFRIDVQSAMYGRNASCYIRIPFTLASAEVGSIAHLSLKVRYDDGFIAYLNGTEIQRANCNSTPTWNAAASGSHPDSQAINFEAFDVSAHRGKLIAGDNLLAIHGLNQSSSNSDFLLSVELVASKAPAGGAPPTGVSPTALRYSSPLALTKSVLVKARVLSGTTWSALNEAVFAVGPVAESLRLSELMYHPLDTGNPDDPNTEYIELTNIGTQTINLNLVRLTKGIDYTFTSFELPAGGYCLLVKDLAAFEAKYGAKRAVVGQYGGSLSNGGERIELVDALGQVIQSFAYSDNWFDITDGGGYSLTVKDPRGTDSGNWSDAGAWRPSIPLGGSPGWDDTTMARTAGTPAPVGVRSLR